MMMAMMDEKKQQPVMYDGAEEEEEDMKLEDKENDSNKFKGVSFYPVGQHLYLASVGGGAFAKDDAKEVKKAKEQRVRVVYILDRSGSMSNTFQTILLPGCQQLHELVKPDDAVTVFFGKTVSVYDVKNAAFFMQHRGLALEDSTNIAAGVAAAVENCTLYQADQQKKEQQQQAVDVLHVLLLMSDGADTVNNKDKLAAVFAECGVITRSTGLNMVMLVVGIGAGSSTAIGMQAKTAVETVQNNAAPVYYARAVNELGGVMKQLAADTRAMATTTRTLLFQCAPLAGETKEKEAAQFGFVANITNAPSCSMALQAGKDQRKFCFLFRSPSDQQLPASITVDGVTVACQLQPVEQQAPINLMFPLIRKHAQLIRINAVAHRETAAALETLSGLVRKVKEQSNGLLQLKSLSANDRLHLMRRLRTRVMGLEQVMNQLKDGVAIAKSMTSDASAQWLVSAQSMKFGATALRRAVNIEQEQVVQDLKQLAAILRGGVKKDKEKEGESNVESGEQQNKQQEEEKDDYFDESVAEPDQSFMSALTANEHLQQLLQLNLDDSNLTVMELLYAFGMLGVCMKVERSESANVNPWNIGVSYVSCDLSDTASSLCALEAGHEVKDILGRDVPDVLVHVDIKNPRPARMFRKTKLHDVYTSVLFTRNLNLFSPSQNVCMLMTAFTQAVVQLRRPATRTLRHISVVFQLLHTIRDRLGFNRRNEQGGFWVELVEKMMKDKPGLYMTETEVDNIQSAVQLLVPLCAMEQAGALFTDKKEQLAVVARAVMAEAASRCGRLERRRGANVAKSDAEIVRLAMGVDHTSIPALPQVELPADEEEGDDCDEHWQSSDEEEEDEQELTMNKENVQQQAQQQQEEEKEKKGDEESMGQKAARAKVDAGGRLAAQFAQIEEDGRKDLTDDYDAATVAQWALMLGRTNCSVLHVQTCFIFADIVHTKLLPKYGGFSGLWKHWRASKGHVDEEVCETVQKTFAAIFDGADGKEEADDKMEAKMADEQLPMWRRLNLKHFVNQYVRPYASDEDKADEKLELNYKLALTVQSVKYCTTKDRKDGVPDLLSPAKYLRELALCVRQDVLADRINTRKRELALQLEKNVGKQAQTIKNFHKYHRGLPRLFTAEEVEELNKKRPDTDQLQLWKGGLLKFACCFRNCPRYLVNFPDRVQLRNHFNPMRWDKSMVENFHTVAVGVWDAYGEKQTAEEFVKRVVQELGPYMESSTRDKAITMKNIDYLFRQLCRRERRKQKLAARAALSTKA